ncbi:N-acyl-aromatic-L-amino acid amidohydrolase (carboxylate-forming) isoform X1 [Alligator sinensis]|uniref:N-acyl-aromatic-L-amino acid amidohydrolase n=1 Tax=Alligator sinensis TaxID=38654 RepID=A0A1U7SPK0_ALLSI|nr:N-acyl-aromatic-L-amino acid amidohydrolase (carboxylate-forming) isoform X1 [Alligator sinensis]
MAALQRLQPVSHVAVSGGTHGNEMSGIYLVKHWLREPSALQRDSFSATPFLANPLAIERCVRYVGRDLNRTFTKQFLNSKATQDEPYEVQRARKINQLYGPKGSAQAFDFLFELHNTTANVGACLIASVQDNLLPMHMCHFIQTHCTLGHYPILLYNLPDQEAYSISSVAKHGLAFELGPQPQGVLRADLLTQMGALVACALDFIDLFNKGTTFPAFETEAYRFIGSVDYPRHPDGELCASVHSKLQDKDFLPLRPGDPIFQTFSGEEILYQGHATIYPVFINEAAYYEKKIAFNKTEKCSLSIPALQRE